MPFCGFCPLDVRVHSFKHQNANLAQTVMFSAVVDPDRKHHVVALSAVYTIQAILMGKNLGNFGDPTPSSSTQFAKGTPLDWTFHHYYCY